MTTNICAEPALYRNHALPRGANRPSAAAADATLEFGRFRMLLRQRRMFADGLPIELGTRAFDLLMVLLEELISRVWPGIVVGEENLKVQISLLRKGLGEDRDFIRTEFGRGYRFTAAVRSTLASGASARCDEGARQIKGLFPEWVARRAAARFISRSLRQAL
jgi:DNA-binding winged helix-turn-helix (wHTH) protein